MITLCVSFLHTHSLPRLSLFPFSYSLTHAMFAELAIDVANSCRFCTFQKPIANEAMYVDCYGNCSSLVTKLLRF